MLSYILFKYFFLSWKTDDSQECSVSYYGNRKIPYWCDSIFCLVLHHAVLWGTVLLCILHYCTVLCYAVLCHAVLYCTLLCGTVLYYAVLYCTVLYCTVLYCTAMYSTLKKYFSSPLEALHKIFNHFFRDRVSILRITSASPSHRLKTFIYLSASSRIQRNLFISTL